MHKDEEYCMKREAFLLVIQKKVDASLDAPTYI